MICQRERERRGEGERAQMKLKVISKNQYSMWGTQVLPVNEMAATGNGNFIADLFIKLTTR